MLKVTNCPIVSVKSFPHYRLVQSVEAAFNVNLLKFRSLFFRSIKSLSFFVAWFLFLCFLSFTVFLLFLILLSGPFEGWLSSLAQTAMTIKASKLIALLQSTYCPLLLWISICSLIAGRLGNPASRRTFATVAVYAALVFGCMFSYFFKDFGVDSFSEVSRTDYRSVISFCFQSIYSPVLTRSRMFISTFVFLAFMLYILTSCYSRFYSASRCAKYLSHATVIAIVILVVHDLYGDIEQFAGYNVYRSSLNAASKHIKESFIANGNQDVDIFVYIGESTNSTAFYQAFKSQTQEAGAAEGLVAFDDVISPHSHTLPSLFRALSFNRDSFQDQVKSDDSSPRPSLIDVLNKFSWHTEWFTNQPENDWISGLFGRSSTVYRPSRNLAAHPTFDTEALDSALSSLEADGTQRKFVIFHSFAGHAGYCENIPLSIVANRQFPEDSLPFKAIYGDMLAISQERFLHNIRCYNQVMHFVSGNLVRVMRQMNRSSRPQILVYFSDHGEDYLSGTGHDSSVPNAMKIEVPLVVYFNKQARRVFQPQYRAALNNRHAAYSLQWMTDSLLDLAQVSGTRNLLSLFRDPLNTPPRISSLRYYAGHYHAIYVDNQPTVPDVLPVLVEEFAKRDSVQSVPEQNRAILCAHRVDSYAKFLNSTSAFDCQEIDVVVTPKENEIYVFHPPKSSTGLTLGMVLTHLPESESGMWVDVKNASRDNLEFLGKYLNRYIPAEKRAHFLIEISGGDIEKHLVSEEVRFLRTSGFSVSYYLPTDEGIRCAAALSSGSAVEFRHRVEQMLISAPYNSLSFDRRAVGCASAIHRDKQVHWNTWDLSVRTPSDLDRGLLEQVDKYLIPYSSTYEY